MLKIVSETAVSQQMILKGQRSKPANLADRSVADELDGLQKLDVVQTYRSERSAYNHSSIYNFNGTIKFF